MAYQMTPLERKARASELKSQRETQASYQRQKLAYEKAEKERQRAEDEKKRQNVFTRSLTTVGDFASNVLTGALKGLEGIYDLGATVVGAVGGIFDTNFQDNVKNHISYDWAGTNVGNPLQELTKNSYLKDGGIIESIASGLGQMLPAVAVSVATGGLGASAAIGRAASLMTLGASATGTSTEEAYKDGAGYYQGLGYGLASGGVEIATEKMFGGLGKLTGKGVLDNATKSIAKTGVKKVAKEAVEEGIEEVVSGLASPALKTIYKGKEALSEYADTEYWKGVAKAGVVGGLTSVAYGQTAGRLLNTTGKEGDVKDALSEINTLKKKESNLFAYDKLDTLNKKGETNRTVIDNSIKENYKLIEETLKNSSDKTRSKIIANYGLEKQFNVDGTLSSAIVVNGLSERTHDGADNMEENTSASIDKRYYTPSLTGNEKMISESLAKQGTAVYSGELNVTEQLNYSKMKKTFSALSQKGLIQPNFIISETSDKFHAYLDGKTVVIGKDALESDIWQKKIIHEVEHFSEGTKEWADYATFIFKNTDTQETVSSILNKNYGIEQSDVDTLFSNLENNNLSEKQKILIEEVTATQSEVLFGNELMIERLVKSNKSLAQKIVARLRNFIEVIKAKTPGEKQLIKNLYQAENLFNKALSMSGANYKMDDTNTTSAIDEQEEVQYNKKGKNYKTPYIQWKSDALAWVNNPKTKIGDIESGADSNYYYFYKAIDPYEDDKATDYRVVAKIRADKYELVKNWREEVKRNNERNNASVYERVDEYEGARQEYRRINSSSLGKHSRNGQGDSIHQGEFGGDGERDTQNSGGDKSKDSLKETRGTSSKSGKNKQKYSLKNSSVTNDINLSDGEFKKVIANNTRQRVYSKSDAESIINNVLSNYLSFGEKYGDLATKTKTEVTTALWKGLNTDNEGYRSKTAENIAEYVLENATMENVFEDIENQEAIATISSLKEYLHSFDLSGIKDEIVYKYDKDKSVYLLWGNRKGNVGLALDDVAQTLFESGVHIKATSNADILFEIDSKYRAAVKLLKNKAKGLLSSTVTVDELKPMKQLIVKEILQGYDYSGSPSKLSKIIEKYESQIRLWREKYYEEKEGNKVLSRLLYKVQKIKDIKLGAFLNASQFKSDIFKNSIESLSNIKLRGNLNKSGTRKIIIGLKEWYVKSNPILEGVYNDEIASMLMDIATGDGVLKTEELRMLSNVVDYFKHFIETYNKVLRNGKYVEAQPIAEGYIAKLRENKNIKVGWFNKTTGSAYVKTFGDPMAVARRMDLYENGFYTETLETLRNSAVDAAVDEMEIRTVLDEFLNKNKKYLKEAEKRTVKYVENDIPIMDALYVYLALGRQQAKLGLEKSGITYANGKETIRINGFEKEGKTVTQMQNEILNQLSELDKQYIDIAKKIFNEDCKDRKEKTDLLRNGYSNISEEEYVPIRRANVAPNVDATVFSDEINRVSNASFNKDTVKGAMQELFVEPLNNVLDRHIHAIAQYSSLAPAIDEYNKLFSLDIHGNKNKPTSVATESVNTWKDGNDYFKRLIGDIQGIAPIRGDGNRAMAFLRRNYAKFQLGANIKVWVTQISSFFAAGSILDYTSIVKGLGVKAKDVDEYCPLAKLRDNDNSAAMAQGVLEKVDKVGDFLMKPIGMVDRFVVKKLFGACQIQVEKTSDLKVGTKENKVEAGKLLKKVIIETQQSAMATERSVAMRSGSEFMKTLTMFTADSMKVFGRFIDSIGEVSVLKTKLKKATVPEVRTLIKSQIKEANKKARKATTSLVSSAIFMALIAQGFKWLYDKDEKEGEEDNIAINMTVDAIGNLMGSLPLIKDVYAKLFEGYDLNSYAYSAINDMLDSASGMFELAENIVTGKADSKDVASNMKKLVYAAGQLFGVPTRNIYNTAYGLTKRFSPSAAYKIDNVFYDKKYASDLAKAIANEDEDLIATITGIMLNEKVGEIESATAKRELNALIVAGYDVLPKSVGDKITYDGEEINLTKRQKEQFKTVYRDANREIASLVETKPYKSASAKTRAGAIKFIYDIYYNLALEDLLGVDLETKNVLFSKAVEIDKLALILSTVKTITADSDKKGNTVTGSKKAKVQAYINSLSLSAAQKYMVMGYLGYSNKHGEPQVKAYIQRLNLSKNQKQTLFAMSGY